ncbi:proteasome assembly chaperone 1-like isoform X2 [Mytilus edulis]|uniref:proteasome assembly chaperone 1-like isoform X2 n=1 Tax=Mytilus edulis TaxID=6550 RepID=UPI0039EFB06E
MKITSLNHSFVFQKQVSVYIDKKTNHHIKTLQSMATFFGEVLPVVSRAVEEDDDNDSESECFERVTALWTRAAKHSMSESGEGKLPCEILIIAVGPAATGFIQTYVIHKNYEIIAGLFSGLHEDDINTLSQKTPTDKSCFLYRKKDCPKILVCQCNITVTPEQAFSFTEQIFPSIKLEDAYVSILCSAHTSEYKADIPISDMEVPFLRSLRSTKYLGTPLAPYVDQPNIVTGLPAQCLSYCQVNKVIAVLYACYTDSIQVDSATMRCFLPLIQSTPIKDIVEKNPKADEMLRTIVDLHTKHNTLYL